MTKIIDKKAKQENKEFFINCIVLIAIILFIRTFIASPFQVDGLSMFETLHHKDYIVIDKLSYRFNEPKRGDIVVVRPPHIEKRTHFVKRIIGLPGETMRFENGRVYIDDKELVEPYYYKRTTKVSRSAPKEITIPEDTYFVMGDNRHHSSDSRSWLTEQNFVDNYNEQGAIPKKYISGKVRFVAFNLSKNFLRWKTFADVDYENIENNADF